MTTKCKVLLSGKWEDASLPFTKPAGGKKILVDYGNKRQWVDVKKVWIVKRNGARAPRSKWNFTERYTKRIGGRYRRVTVKPVVFDRGNPNTDFNYLINTGNKSNGFAFNDNLSQWSEAIYKEPFLHGAGGGNAIIRPSQVDGFSFGIPTGFCSLQQNVTTTQHVLDAGVCELSFLEQPETPVYRQVNAKQIIQHAFDRALLHMYKHPEKDVYHYSADPDDPNRKRLGLAIFAASTGDDVVDYITECFDKLPQAFSTFRNTGKSVYTDRALGPLVV